MNIYEDWRGWLFKVVRSPRGDKPFRVRCKNPGGEGRWRAVGVLAGRATLREAEADLDDYAYKRRMRVKRGK